MTYPNKPSYSHGASGTAPSSPLDYERGDPVDQAEFDYYVNTEFTYIKSLIDALAAIDSDNDEKVDAADSADDATNATSSYKNNDIDADGDGRVNSADAVAGPDGSVHAAGSLPQFSGTSTAITNTSEGSIFYITGDNSVYMNNGGSAINLTKKYVDILVNGGQQASYSQYDTNGDYNLDVSTDNLIWGETSGSHGYASDASQTHSLVDLSSLQFSQPNGGVTTYYEIYFFCETNVDYYGNELFYLNRNGTTYASASGSDGGSTTHLLVNESGTPTSSDMNTLAANWEFEFDTGARVRWDYNIFFRVEPTFSVNSVSQTTSN